MTDRLDSSEILARHLEGLLALDPRLIPVLARAGRVEIRRAAPGFAGMAQIVCGQQLSVASARAIWGRFAALEGATNPQGFLAIEETRIRSTGFSQAKCRTLRAVATAVLEGALDFEALALRPAAEAMARLTALPGVGPWTAGIYLMFCAGHPDIFPVGDLALRKAVGHALGMDDAPDVRDLAIIAATWSPHRATAALLFWRYYAALRRKEGVAL